MRHEHGERFTSACLDKGNSPATVAKKIRHIKRVFQLAVDRVQLEANPLKRVRQSKSPRRKVRVYGKDELDRIVRIASTWKGGAMRCDLMVLLSATTGMRRGELLNLCWQDIDFEKKTIDVQPKSDTSHTWQWHVKDTDRRRLPLTEELLKLLVVHQAQQPAGYPYVFIPPSPYDAIGQLRKQGKWSVQRGCNSLNNFTRQFELILKRAGIENGEFHDLRRTCLTEWFRQGMAEFDVMTLAGHANFETTRTFYLAIDGDGLLDRDRVASAETVKSGFVAQLLRALESAHNAKGPTSVSTCQPETCVTGQSRS